MNDCRCNFWENRGDKKKTIRHSPPGMIVDYTQVSNTFGDEVYEFLSPSFDRILPYRQRFLSTFNKRCFIASGRSIRFSSGGCVRLPAKYLAVHIDVTSWNVPLSLWYSCPCLTNTKANTKARLET